MKISVSTIFCSVLLILLARGAIISNLDSKGVGNNFTINIENTGPIQIALPIYCRTGSVLRSNVTFGNILQVSLLVDSVTQKGDCFGVIRLNQSIDYGVYFRTSAGYRQVLEYTFEPLASNQSSNSLYQLTSTRNISNRYEAGEPDYDQECTLPYYMPSVYYNSPCYTTQLPLSNLIAGIGEASYALYWTTKFNWNAQTIFSTQFDEPIRYHVTPQGVLEFDDVVEEINQ